MSNVNEPSPEKYFLIILFESFHHCVTHETTFTE